MGASARDLLKFERLGYVNLLILYPAVYQDFYRLPILFFLYLKVSGNVQ